ncbi:hypothetical protein [Bordetella genomosp. 9]|uniref:hypothetical protein n=1 Tax=Bordetella genomosp. 9 TaxID=1416803 RepID=UPI0011779B2F|nr:hypothetical protein [Bordetella genomosp. 9]
MKRPAFQFYPGDWRKDAALQSCSLEARGLWHELLCLMHECEPYGHLAINGNPMKPAQVARLVGVSERDYRKLLAELTEAGVPSFTDDGVVFSRRMVRDEHIRNVRAEAGKLGGNPSLLGDKVKQKDKQTSNQDPTPSSSSSSSKKKHTSADASLPARFAEFWDTWPASERKVAKAKCAQKWRARRLDDVADQILAHVEALKSSKSWRDGFEPAPLTYLNQSRWEDGVPADGGRSELFEGGI